MLKGFGLIAVNKTLFDFLPEKVRRVPQNVKVDANDILRYPDVYQANLDTLIRRVVNAAEPEFEIAAKEIEQQNLFAHEQKLHSDSEHSLPTPAASSQKPRADFHVDADDVQYIRYLLKEYVHACKLERSMSG